MTSKARLTVWDEDTGETVATIELVPRAIQGAFDSAGEVNFIGIVLETQAPNGPGPEVEVRPEWVGKTLNIEIAPSAINDLGPDFELMTARYEATVA